MKTILSTSLVFFNLVPNSSSTNFLFVTKWNIHLHETITSLTPVQIRFDFPYSFKVRNLFCRILLSCLSHPILSNVRLGCRRCPKRNCILFNEDETTLIIFTSSKVHESHQGPNTIVVNFNP